MFSDFGGYLVMNEASLGALNDRLQNKVTFRTFRPNIVISGCDAFAEVLLFNYHNYVIAQASEFWISINKVFNIYVMIYTPSKSRGLWW